MTAYILLKEIITQLFLNIPNDLTLLLGVRPKKRPSFVDLFNKIIVIPGKKLLREKWNFEKEYIP